MKILVTAVFVCTVGASAQPVAFEENNDPKAPFCSRQSGFTALFQAGGVELRFRGGESAALRFSGANPGVRPEGEGLLSGHSAFFQGAAAYRARWFRRVIYRDLYPGADLIFFLRNNRLTYNWKLAAGADPHAAALRYEGPFAAALQQSPLEDQASAPALVYSSYLGGSRADSANAVAADSQGNIYLAGSTNSYDFSRTQAGPAPPASGNLLMSPDGGKTYLRSAINNAVLSLAATPAAVFAGTSAGPYRSVDGGRTFQPANLGISGAANVLLADVHIATRLYAATGKGVFRSDDSAQTWSAASQGLPPNALVSAMVSSPDALFIVANQSVYRSRDSAQTWSPCNLPISPVGPAPATLAIDPANSKIIYVAGAYNNTAQQAFLLKSVDGGVAFQQISSLPVLTSAQAIAIDPANSSSLFAAGIDGAVYHSADGGNSWVATPLKQVTLDAVVFDPANPANLYALADQGLFLSADHGVTWQPTSPQSPKRDLRTIFFLPGAIFLGQDSGQHVFLAKWNAAGDRLLWSIVLGGSYSDEAVSVAVDSSGNPYVTGTTASTDFPVTPGAFQTSLNGFQNVFVTKVDSSGSRLLYSTLLGGSASDGVSALAVDAQGSAYLAGYAVSPDFPTTPHAFQPRHNGDCNGHAGGDAYVARLSPDAAALTYSTLIGGSCAQTATGIALNAAGNAYISGATVSPDFPVTSGVLQPAYAGASDGFLAELSPAGNALVFATYLGGPNADIAAGVAVDASGYIYIAGNGIGFPFVAAPSVPLQCGGSVVSYGGLSLEVASQPYLLKVNPGATGVEWLRNFADCGTVVQSLALDSSGKTWLGGIAGAANYDTVAPLQTLAAGGFFLREYAADSRTVLFSTLLDSFNSFALDANGAVYVAADRTAQPSAGVLKIDPSLTAAVAIDSVQKTGDLSIPALADYSGPIGVAPGELISVAGRGFGPVQGARVTNGFVDTSLGNVTITFDGQAAPLIAVQDDRIICSAPYALAGKQRSQIRVIENGVSSNPVTVSVTAAAVEVLELVNQDGTINSTVHPAPAGSTMTLYASGLGTPNGTPADGQVSSAMPQTFVSPVSVTFNDPAPIVYLGPAPGLVSGVTQINFVVPAVEGQSVLSVSAGSSTDFVFVYVR